MESDDVASEHHQDIHTGTMAGVDASKRRSQESMQRSCEGTEDFDEQDISVLETNIIQQSRTIDDFTRIISEWRADRDNRQEGIDGHRVSTEGQGNTLQVKSSSTNLSAANVSAFNSLSNGNRKSLDVDGASQCSYDPSSIGDPDEGIYDGASNSQMGNAQTHFDGSSSAVKVRCTCCCGRGTRRCRRARRATREWNQIENDLHLAAQIGQALLRRTDALQSELSSKEEESSSKINSIMKRLSSSIKEASHLEKRLEQSDLNLEAADASNRALVRELEECRRELSKARASHVKSSGLDGRLQRAERELEDLQQEVTQERKQAELSRAMLKRADKLNADLSRELSLARMQRQNTVLSEEERVQRREDVRKAVEARMSKPVEGATQMDTPDAEWIDSLLSENEGLQQNNAEMKRILENRNEEITLLREELTQKQEFISEATASTLSSVATLKEQPLRLVDLETQSTSLSNEMVEDVSIPRQSSLRRSSSWSRPHSPIPHSSISSEAFKSSQTSMSQRSASGTHADEKASGLLSPNSHPIALPFLSSPTMSSSSTNVDASSDFTSHAGDGLKGKSSTLQPSTARRETRTMQLMSLVEYIQRLYSRLSSADVETMGRRLQRQKLTGDVGHLTRTTVNGILRDVDGLRDHFRRSMENETKGRDADAVSVGSKNSGKSEKTEFDSLVTRKDFFALIKTFRDLFIEMARLRNAVNEVCLQPQQAGRILQEQLGVQSLEDKGMGAWIGRFFSGSGLPGASLAGGSSIAPNATNSASSSAAHVHPGNMTTTRPSGDPRRALSNPITTTARAAPAVVPSAVAVEVKRSHASEASNGGDGISNTNSPQPSSHEDASATLSADLPSYARPQQTRRQASLSRTQSRNLGGLFVGSMAREVPTGIGSPNESNQLRNTTNHRLSRIVDDDEVSLHQSFVPKARTLRPRNLSDSSMHTTFLQDEQDTDSQDYLDDRKPTSGEHHGLGLPFMGGTPAAISRIAAPPAQANKENNPTSRQSNPSSGLLSGLAQSGPMAKAFGYLSSTTNPAHSGTHQHRPPGLRPKTSQAQLSLAAASATGQSHNPTP